MKAKHIFIALGLGTVLYILICIWAYYQTPKTYNDAVEKLKRTSREKHGL